MIQCNVVLGPQKSCRVPLLTLLNGTAHCKSGFRYSCVTGISFNINLLNQIDLAPNFSLLPLLVNLIALILVTRYKQIIGIAFHCQMAMFTVNDNRYSKDLHIRQSIGFLRYYTVFPIIVVVCGFADIKHTDNIVVVTYGYMRLINCPVSQIFGQLRFESGYHLQKCQIKKVFKGPFV